MREILFRGKRMDNGEWVEGDLLHPDIFGNGYSIEDFTKGKNNCFDVDEKTLGQWTGLVDKSGVKIFEGDKVRYPDSSSTFNDDEVNEGFVEWDAECMCFYFTNRFIIEMDEFDIVNGVMVDVEVIGNIHDKAVKE